MMRRWAALILGLTLGLAACAASKSDRDIIADACIAEGESLEPFCTCFADAMEANLTPQTLGKIAKGVKDGKSQSEAEDALTMAEKTELLTLFPHSMRCANAAVTG